MLGVMVGPIMLAISTVLPRGIDTDFIVAECRNGSINGFLHRPEKMRQKSGNGQFSSIDLMVLKSVGPKGPCFRFRKRLRLGKATGMSVQRDS